MGATGRPRLSLIRLLFTLRGSILPTIAPRMGVVVAFSALVAAARSRWPQDAIGEPTPEPLRAVASVLR